MVCFFSWEMLAFPYNVCVFSSFYNNDVCKTWSPQTPLSHTHQFHRKHQCSHTWHTKVVTERKALKTAICLVQNKLSMFLCMLQFVLVHKQGAWAQTKKCIFMLITKTITHSSPCVYRNNTLCIPAQYHTLHSQTTKPQDSI